MNYDDRLAKLAVAYNNCNYTEVNSVALAMVDDFKAINSSQRQRIQQLKHENAELRLTVEHAATTLGKRLERIVYLEIELQSAEVKLEQKEATHYEN